MEWYIILTTIIKIVFLNDIIRANIYVKLIYVTIEIKLIKGRQSRAIIMWLVTNIGVTKAQILGMLKLCNTHSSMGGYGPP